MKTLVVFDSLDEDANIVIPVMEKVHRIGTVEVTIDCLN